MSDTRVLVSPYIVGAVNVALMTPPVGGLTLQLQLDASVSGSVATTGGPPNNVNTWTDQTINNWVFSFINQRPTYPGTTQNGHNTMSFPASTFAALQCTTFAQTQPFVIFAVVNMGSTGALLDSSNTSNVISSFIQGGAINGQMTWDTGAGGATSATNFLSPVAWYVIALQTGPDTIFTNSGASADGTTGASGSNHYVSGSGMQIAMTGSSTFNLQPLLIGELRLYSGTPNAGDVSTIISQLRTKWGI
jgi:hypothetical protein